MNSNSLIKIYIVLPALLAVFNTSIVSAQESNTTPQRAEIDLLKYQSLWKKSGNAAGLLLDKPFQYSTLDVSYDQYGGNFRRPQQPGSGNSQSIHTEGNLLVSDYFLTGSFSYKRDNIKDAEFNASIIDPFRGMPFIIADLNSSDWNNQHYDLRFAIATPKFKDKWSFGLKGTYQASSGAKQRDVRTANNYYKINVEPGIVFSASDEHNFGLNLAYSNFKEEARMLNVNVYFDQTYYELLGLGTAVSYVGSGRSNNNIGDGAGVGFQYNYKGDINIMADVSYNLEAEDVDVSFTLPREAASVLRKIWNAGLSFQKVGAEYIQGLDLSIYNRDMDGIQYITERDGSSAQIGYITVFKSIRSTYSTQRLSAKYNLISKINESSAYSWKLNAGVVYEKLNDEYLLPNSQKQFENVLFTLGGEKNFKLSDAKASRLLVGLELGYNDNKSGKYDYNGAHSDYPIVTNLEQNDFNYLTSNYFSVSVPVTYSQQLNQTSRTSVFIKAYGNYMKTDNFNYNERYAVGLSIGSNF